MHILSEDEDVEKKHISTAKIKNCFGKVGEAENIDIKGNPNKSEVN